MHLDQDQKVGPITDTEDAHVMYLYKAWHNTMQGTNLWNHIARHIKSRTAPMLQNRFNRISPNESDINFANMKKYSDDLTHPASYHFHQSHTMSLTIVGKSSSTIMDITTKLQHEVRMVVAGTPMEVFLLPCKYTAIRCTHMNMEQNKFTYDPDKPDQQFLNYLKLTFANSLKKAKLVDSNFEWNSIIYNGENIHSIMATAEAERFILPKDDFMKLNRRQVGANMLPNPTQNPPSPAGQPRQPPAGQPPPAPKRGRGRPPKHSSTNPQNLPSNIERGLKRKSFID